MKGQQSQHFYVRDTQEHTHTKVYTDTHTLADELQMLHNVCGKAQGSRYNFVFCCAIERATEAKNCAKEKEKELRKMLAKALNGMQHKWESSSFMPSNGICIRCCCTDKAMPDRLDLLPTKSLLYIYRINLLAACEIQFQLAAQWIPFKQAHLLLNLQHFD